jgi:diguanylate cyclase (GGDEF)-like protein
LKILIAEDEKGTRVLLENLLTEWGFEVVSVATGPAAWDLLRTTDSPQLAVLDWMMPGIEGDEICRMVRKAEEKGGDYTYLILLTAKESKEYVIRGLEAGADDYIVKPVDPSELKVRVRVGQRIIQLQSDLLAAKHDLLEQSRTDPLTGVLNRRAILSQIESELNRSERTDNPSSLALLDIDHFKAINDTYGHLAGDAVLKECVRRIGKIMRSYDSLGRLGGEEFLMLFPGTSESQALAICERIRGVIGEEPVVFKGVAISLTVSQGVVTANTKSSVDEIIDRVDQAMYRAKRNGRNRVDSNVR